MDTVARAREASIKVAKIQRRLWLIQTLWWPFVAIVGALAAFFAARSIWRQLAPTRGSRVHEGLSGVANGNQSPLDRGDDIESASQASSRSAGGAAQ